MESWILLLASSAHRIAGTEDFLKQEAESSCLLELWGFDTLPLLLGTGFGLSLATWLSALASWLLVQGAGLGTFGHRYARLLWVSGLCSLHGQDCSWDQADAWPTRVSDTA